MSNGMCSLIVLQFAVSYKPTSMLAPWGTSMFFNLEREGNE